ncbi:MAG: ABC transporter substrate-binding protein [Desulfobacterales bacterium]
MPFSNRSMLWLLVFLSATPSSLRAGERLRFGILPVVDTLPLLVAESEGLFTREGIDLEIVQFQSALERDAALQAGRLDGYFGDLLNTILLVRAGERLGIVTTVFHTHPEHRMFGIAVSPGSGVRSLDGLRHKTVAISRTTVIEYLLDRILERHGLPADYLVKEEIKKIPIRLQMLLADQVAAALLPEPLLTLAESRGARVIADDRDLDTSETVLALAAKGGGNSVDVGGFLRAYGEAVNRINRSPESYKDLLLEKTRFPAEVKDRYRVPIFPEVKLPSEADVGRVQEWLIDSGVMERRLPYEAVIYRK